MTLMKKFYLLVNRFITFYIIRQTHISQLDTNNTYTFLLQLPSANILIEFAENIADFYNFVLFTYSAEISDKETRSRMQLFSQALYIRRRASHFNLG